MVFFHEHEYTPKWCKHVLYLELDPAFLEPGHGVLGPEASEVCSLELLVAPRVLPCQELRPSQEWKKERKRKEASKECGPSEHKRGENCPARNWNQSRNWKSRGRRGGRAMNASLSSLWPRGYCPARKWNPARKGGKERKERKDCKPVPHLSSRGRAREGREEQGGSTRTCGCTGPYAVPRYCIEGGVKPARSCKCAAALQYSSVRYQAVQCSTVQSQGVTDGSYGCIGGEPGGDIASTSP